MTLTPEQNAAWCRKCIDLINGDETVNEPQIREFPALDRIVIETCDQGVLITQACSSDTGSGDDHLFLPDYFIERFIAELREVAGLA